MKSLSAYITESKKTYNFKLRLACEMTSEMEGKIKQALEAYKVDSISKPKRLPIQESPMFPNMGPVEINMIDVSVCYPCNDDQIRALVAECGCCPAAAIRVTPADHPYEAIMDGKEVSNPDGDVVLDTPELKSNTPAGLVGDERVANLMKELAAARAYQLPAAEGGKTPAAKTTSDAPEGKLSPVGSKQNKIPSPKK